jgi:hypothetical protein
MSCYYLEPRGLSLTVLLSHLPLGMAWEGFRTAGKVAYRLYKSFAESYEDAWEALCRLAIELDPRTTTELIDEWEKALSLPDPCLPKYQSLEDRRKWIMWRLDKRRWSTAADWIELALLFDVRIAVTPGWRVQKPALYDASYPKRYDLFPKLGRFRVYINQRDGACGGYPYGGNSGGPGYPILYGCVDKKYLDFQCLIERVKPANVIIIWDAPLELYGICTTDTFEPTFSEEFC